MTESSSRRRKIALGLSSAVVVGMLERNPGGGDHLDGLVVNGLAARPAVLEPKIDRHEIEPDRQRLGQPMDGLRELRADAVAQEFRHLVGGTHERQGLQRATRVE